MKVSSASKVSAPSKVSALRQKSFLKAHSRESRVYLNCSVFLAPKPIDECKIWDPITRRCENKNTEIWEEKIYNLYPSYNAKLKCMITKFKLLLPLGLHRNCLTQRQF